MATYSLAVTGAAADSKFAVANLTLDDANAQRGDQQSAMQLGTQILCKRADGSFGWYTLDAERSTPARPILLAV